MSNYNFTYKIPLGKSASSNNFFCILPNIPQLEIFNFFFQKIRFLKSQIFFDQRSRQKVELIWSLWNHINSTLIFVTYFCNHFGSRFRNDEKMSQADLNGTSENHPISKLRQAFPQFCAVSAKNLLMITFGSTLGFSTILIPELQKDNAEIPVSIEELTWISEHLVYLASYETKQNCRTWILPCFPERYFIQTIEFRIQIVNNFFLTELLILHILYNFYPMCDKDKII